MKLIFKLLSILFLLTFVPHGFGLPEGTTGVVGEGGYQITGSEMVITAPDGSVFEHQNFNVLEGETVRFLQPSTDARVLNRILSENASMINGTVEANGRLYFAAPNGLIFGSGAIIQAAQLHAIAGDLSNADFGVGGFRYADLSGEVENRGIISADDVVLGGRSVNNSGSINSPKGSVILAVGRSMEVYSTDSILGVELSQQPTVPDLGAVDLASQAILQSGILQASKVKLMGNKITQSGKIEASEVSFSRFSNLSGSTGKIFADKVDLVGAYDGEAENAPSSLSSTWIEESKGMVPVAHIDSSENEISRVEARMTFQELKVKSAVKMEFASYDNLPTILAPKVQHLDIRVGDGDLIMGVSFAPVFSSDKSSLLLAASKKITSDTILIPNSYSQSVILTENEKSEIFGGGSSLPMGWYLLNASSIGGESLSSPLDSLTLLNLANENPEFTGFYEGAENFLINLPSNWDEILARQISPENPIFDEISPSVYYLLEGAISFEDFFKNAQDSLLGISETERSISLAQIDLLLSLGLYSNYSYLLDSATSLQTLPDEPKSMENQIGDLGGSSSLFGGSFDLAQQAIEPIANDSSTESTDESQESVDDEKSFNDSASQANVSAVSQVRKFQLPQAVAPFAPISRPVLSTAASLYLKNALSERVEDELSKYLD